MPSKGTGGNFLSRTKQSPAVPVPICKLEMLGTSEGHAESDSIQGATHSDGEVETGQEEEGHREESEGLIIKETTICGSMCWGRWNGPIF